MRHNSLFLKNLLFRPISCRSDYSKQRQTSRVNSLSEEENLFQQMYHQENIDENILSSSIDTEKLESYKYFMKVAILSAKKRKSHENQVIFQNFHV